MTFQELANSKLLWISVSVGIMLVVAIIMYYFVICYRHAIKVGVKKETIREVIKSSMTFSIVPSIAIVAGIATLALVIGLPYSWFRLSVLGSVTYELMAADMALKALSLNIATADGYAFVLMAWAMCIGITAPLVFNIFICKKVHMGTLKLGAKDQRWGALSQTVFMTALLCALIVPMLFGGLPSLLTFITSAVIACVLSALAEKMHWESLNSFILVISLIGATASSILWDKLF